jgi:hypothetical protein
VATVINLTLKGEFIQHASTSILRQFLLIACMGERHTSQVDRSSPHEEMLKLKGQHQQATEGEGDCCAGEHTPPSVVQVLINFSLTLLQQ